MPVRHRAIQHIPSNLSNDVPGRRAIGAHIAREFNGSVRVGGEGLEGTGNKLQRYNADGHIRAQRY